MSVLTVCCHGTGFSSVTPEDELVQWVHTNISGTEATIRNGNLTPGNYIVNEGPGHGDEARGVPLPNKVNPDTGVVRKKYRWIPGATTYKKATGGLGGHGWDANIRRTINIIDWLQTMPDVVNLVGWSRGAVTCIRIANALLEIYPQNSPLCNIFAVDPVAGWAAGKNNEDMKVIGSNVDKCVVVLAMHECRRTFTPQDLSRLKLAQSTEFVILPMPGVHCGQVKIQQPPEAAYVTRNLACAFLKSCGTPLENIAFAAEAGSAALMSNAYAAMVLQMSAVQKIGFNLDARKTGAGQLRRRDFAKSSQMDNYTRGGKGSYWVNEHHRACFKRAFPTLYEAIFLALLRGHRKNDIVSLAEADPNFSFRRCYRLEDLANSLLAKDLIIRDNTGYKVMVGGGTYGGRLVAHPWPDSFPLCTAA